MKQAVSSVQDSSSGLRLGDMVSEYMPNNATAKPWWGTGPRPAVAPAPEVLEDRGGLRVGLPQ